MRGWRYSVLFSPHTLRSSSAGLCEK
jgi:hypothetical protein